MTSARIAGGPSRRRFGTDQGQIADRDGVRLGGIGGGAAAWVAEGVELLDIVQPQPGARFDPLAQRLVQGAVAVWVEGGGGQVAALRALGGQHHWSGLSGVGFQGDDHRREFDLHGAGHLRT
jgi:hypothetical protein